MGRGAGALRGGRRGLRDAGRLGGAQPRRVVAERRGGHDGGARARLPRLPRCRRRVRCRADGDVAGLRPPRLPRGRRPRHRVDAPGQGAARTGGSRVASRAGSPCSRRTSRCWSRASPSAPPASPRTRWRSPQRSDDRDIEVVGLAILGSALIASGRGRRRREAARRRGGAGRRRAVRRRARRPAGRCATPCRPAPTSATSAAPRSGVARCERYSERWAARHFFGICRTAYGGVLTAHGDWPSAELELTSAVEDLHAARPGLAAPAAVRLGQLRVRQGRADEARRLFETALPLPQAVVAIGELDLERGDAAAAADAAERVLRRLGTASALERLPALELLARARAAAGEHDAAHAAVDEVERRRAGARHAVHARPRAAWCAAEVLLAAGDRTTARAGGRGRGRPLLRMLGAVRGGAGAARAGRRARGAGPLRARRGGGEGRARGVRAARRARRRARHCGRGPHPRELDVLRLVANGLSDAEIAGRLFLSPHTVHRHVANVRTKLRLPSRAAAVAHATRAGLL